MMSVRTTLKLVSTFALLGLSVATGIGYPNYMNQFALDPRSKADLRSNCAICHTVDGKKSDPAFLSPFGRDFKSAGFKITQEMRDKYTWLFIPPDTAVANVAADVVKVSTEQVIVNVTVTDVKGRYITGLDKKAFSLMEDGIKQLPSAFLGEDAPLAVAVVIDTSGSTLAKDLEKINKSVIDLAVRLHPEDVLSVYTFGEGGVQQIRGYESSIRDLKPILNLLRGGGDTPLYDAVLRATADLKQRPERRRALILISDGADTTSQKTLYEAGRETFLAGVSIYSIDTINNKGAAKRSPERQAGATALRQLAEETGGRYIVANGGFFVSSRSQLKKAFSDLIDELHKQYTITYEPGNLRRAGRWRTLRISMEQSDLNARARIGYREGVQ